MTEPSQYPKPVASGGAPLVGYRTLRAALAPAGFDMRQPDLGSPPGVLSVSGFGTGGNMGAGLAAGGHGSGADQSQGVVTIRTGLVSIAGSGTIVLRFPIAPGAGQYLVVGDWASFVPTPAGNNLSIAWTANRTLGPNERLRLSYGWAVSQ